MEPKIRGWFFVGLVLNVAVVVNLFAATFGMKVGAFIYDERPLVRIVVAAVGVLLVAAAVLLRLKFGRGSLYLASDRSATFAFVAAAPLVFYICVVFTLRGVWSFPYEFITGSWLFLFVCGLLTSVRAGKGEWVVWIGLYFMVVAVLCSLSFSF